MRIESSDEPVVNTFASSHGDYRDEAMPVTAGELGEARHGQVRVTRNRGGTTVERWLASSSLTSGQAEAIALYARSWRLWIGEQRVTANWSLTATIRGMDAGAWVPSRIEAKAMLEHLDECVFKAMPAAYVDVWKNVVIFDEAAGVAGSRLGYKNARAEAAAKTIVLFIADIIATVMRLGEP